MKWCGVKNTAVALFSGGKRKSYLDFLHYVSYGVCEGCLKSASRDFSSSDTKWHLALMLPFPLAGNSSQLSGFL